MSVSAAQAISYYNANHSVSAQVVADTTDNMKTYLSGLQTLQNASKLQSVTVTGTGNTVDASTATSLAALTGFVVGSGATMVVADTASKLLNNATGRAKATTVRVTGTSNSVSAAQAITLAALPNFALASGASLTLTGANTVNASDATKLAGVIGWTLASGATLVVADSATNLLNSSYATGLAKATTVRVTGTSNSVSAAQAITLAALPNFALASGASLTLIGANTVNASDATKLASVKGWTLAPGATLVVADSATNLLNSSYGTGLAKATSLQLNGTANTATFAQLVTLSALPSYTLATGAKLTVQDTAARIIANLDKLQTYAAAGKLTAIRSTTLFNASLPASQIGNDYLALSYMSSAYTLHPTGTLTVAQILNMTNTILSHIVGSFTVADTLATIIANLARLKTITALSKITSIQLTDPSPPTAAVSSTLMSSASSVLDLVNKNKYTLNITDGPVTISSVYDVFNGDTLNVTYGIGQLSHALYVNNADTAALNIWTGGRVNVYGTFSDRMGTLNVNGGILTTGIDTATGDYAPLTIRDTLNITNGGQVLVASSNFAPYVGCWIGGRGDASQNIAQVTVSGVGSLLNTGNNPLRVGDSAGTGGSVTISSGGKVITGTTDNIQMASLVVGRFSGGSLTISGVGSELISNGNAYIGRSNIGTLTMNNGALLTIGPDVVNQKCGLYIGASSGSYGILQTWIQTGGAGSATLDSGAGIISQGSVRIGYGGCAGSVTVGQNSYIEANDRLYVGSTITLAAGGTLINTANSDNPTAVTVQTNLLGQGVLNINNGGEVAVNNGGMMLGDSGGSAGTITVAAGGNLLVNGSVQIAAGSTLDIAGGQAIFYGDIAQTGIISMENGGTFDATNTNSAAAVTINTGSDLASVSAGLSFAGNLQFINNPNTIFLGDGATNITYTMKPSSGIDLIQNFQYGIDQLNIDLNGASNTKIFAANTNVGGIAAISIYSSENPSTGIVLGGMTNGQTAADLLAKHLTFSNGHAIIN